MKRRRRFLAAALAIVAIGFFAAARHRVLAAGRARYVAIDLSSPGEDSIAWAINNRGQVVVQSGSRSFLWDNGATIDLGGMAAWGISDDGVVVGNAGGHAVVWEKGVLRDLPSPGAIGAVALAINNRGQIVGLYTSSDRVEHACLWQRDPSERNRSVGDPTVMIDLGAPAARLPFSRAIGINERGQIVGFSFPDVDTGCVFVWDQGALSNVLCRSASQFRLPVGISNPGEVAVTGLPSVLLSHKGTVELSVMARGIGPNGLVACEFSPFGQPHACLWDRGVVTDLGLSFTGLSVALAVNTRAELVGWSYDGSTRRNHAVLWRPAP